MSWTTKKQIREGFCSLYGYRAMPSTKHMPGHLRARFNDYVRGLEGSGVITPALAERTYVPEPHDLPAPSAAHRWRTCPGSRAVAESLPEDQGPAARGGTEAHEVIERALTPEAEGS